jgi:hypothetical protein
VLQVKEALVDAESVDAHVDHLDMVEVLLKIRGEALVNGLAEAESA